MASQAGLLSNHYDVLGLSPSASQDEIGGAFARALARFAAHPVAAKLHLYEAFGVLREPDKRRAYDRSIGLEAEIPTHFTYLVPPGSGSTFSVAARAVSVEPEPVAAPVAAIETVRPTVEHVEAEEADLRQLVETIRADGRAGKDALRRSERQPQDWRRMGIAAGALILGAGLIGGIAGVSANEPSSEDVLADTPPTPSAYLKGSAPSRDFDAEAEAQVRAENQAAARIAAPVKNERTISPLLVPPELQGATVPKPAVVVAEAKPEPMAVASAVDPLAPEPEAASAVTAARMPLPNATIARTIEKIGYPCGAVASIAPVEGAVFKVNCSSGHAYRAAPTGGRYRFKKWSGA